jgi:hypothetical protein
VSAADCRADRCSCAGKTANEAKTLTQTLEFGWHNDDGTYHWKPDRDTVQVVSQVWADHLRNRYQARIIEELPDGIIVHTCPAAFPEAVTRIRWAAA